MNRTVLRTHDVYNFKVLPNPLNVGHQPLTQPNGYDSHYHPQVGLLQYKNVSFPHMHVMDLKWKAKEAISMVNDKPFDTINFNFQLSGNHKIKYGGLGADLSTTGGQHYMVYHPEESYSHSIAADSSIEVLHISMDKDFFAASLGSEDAWTEELQSKMYLNKSFSGLNRPLEITPQMWQLIRDIKTDRNYGPMRNLLIQSKALELVALQMDQLRKPTTDHSEIKEEDAEKLHHLKTYLDANFLSELSLAQLSKQCLLNEFKVKRGFKLLFGSSVFNYLRKIRMEYAVSLLKKESRTVDEVADILGYEHAQHFSSAFKSFMGVSPSYYQTGKVK